jgi:hypothetical protein
MEQSKRTKVLIAIPIVVILLIAIDLGFLRAYGSDSYSVIRNLYCALIKQEEYAHISSDSVYSSSGDYLYIYQCGNEYDEAHPAG